MVVVMVRVRVRDRVRAALRLGATPTRANQGSARGPHLAFTLSLLRNLRTEKKVLPVGRRLKNERSACAVQKPYASPGKYICW